MEGNTDTVTIAPSMVVTTATVPPSMEISQPLHHQAWKVPDTVPPSMVVTTATVPHL